MAAVVGAAYLVTQHWPGPQPGRMHDKADILHADEELTPAQRKDQQTLTAAEKQRRRHHPPLGSGKWTSRYDGYFRKYSKRYFGPGFDWRWFKSQAVVESTLNPHAHSGAGAVGLMQITPLTFKDIRRRKPHVRTTHSPRWNIAAGIGYMRYLYQKKAIRSLANDTRLYLAFASYNRGYSGMLRVMRKAPPAELGWRGTLKHAPSETRHYVERIISVKTGRY